MTAYPDTSYLCSLYRKQIFTEAALAFRESFPSPLPYTELLEFEFVQSIRLQVWLHSQDRNKGFGEREADHMIADWEADVASGLFVLVPCDMTLVFRLAHTYSLQRTAKQGHRTLDVLHVATAVHLGAKEFLTFDARQRSLAHYAGLATPLMP